MQIIEIVGLLLGGTGLGAFLNHLFLLKSNKKKGEYEAEIIGAESEKKTFDVQKDQSEYLIEKLTQYQKEYYTLEDEHREQMKNLLQEMKVQQDSFLERSRAFENKISDMQREFNEKISKKCEEIAQLKSAVTYYKGLRCYKTDCKNRICENPDNKIKNDNNK